MKQKVLLLSCALSCTIFVAAQTGPGGVGNSTNNVLWLKADKGTSTTTAGAALSSWTDQSGNGINVSQGTAAQRPTYAASVMNGFPAIEFDNNTTAGQNDFLTAADNALLDNTAGYTFFTVSRMKGLNGEAKSIISKRTAIDTDEAFMLFFYSANHFYADIDGLGNRFNTSPATYAINTNYIIDAVFDGTLPAANRSKVYEGETLRKTAAETSTTVADKASPLVIGATHTTDNRPFNGYIPELIIYRTALNDASRIIVNNYLSSKYNIALSANDKYAGDTPANGDFDYEVAGVGSETGGSNNSFASSVAAGLGISVNSGLDAGDYILAGHNLVNNAQITSDVAGMTGTSNARWQRIWYFDVTNTSTNISTNIEFDMSDGISGGVTPGPVANYVLLYRAGTSGAWTELAVASAVSGDKVQFNGYTLTNDGYYTIGTKNFSLSPLPVELLSFNAVAANDRVNLSWQTASETNNDYFTVEKSRDGFSFDPAFFVNGAGTSTHALHYSETDFSPYPGISYYRLMQTDFDGSSSYSAIVPVNYLFADDGMSIYPNPAAAGEEVTVNFSGLNEQEVLVVVHDMLGREHYSKVKLLTENDRLVAVPTDNRLSAGTYIIVASSNNRIYSQKLIVR